MSISSHRVLIRTAQRWRNTYQGMLSDNFLSDKLLANRLELWNRRLGSPTDNQFTIVAQYEEDVVGFACAFGGENPKWGSLLDNLHVQPTQKGRGIGKTLMAAIANWCSLEYSKTGLYLLVFVQNAQAVRRASNCARNLCSDRREDRAALMDRRILGLVGTKP